MECFFSIIIPTYNSAKTICATIDSILMQQFKDFELLIVDGISSDNTKDLVQGYKDERISFFSEKDKGVYDAMNKGIKYSKGKYLYFIGSDDKLFDKDVLQTVFYSLSSEPVDIIYGNSMLLSNNELDAGVEMNLERLLFKQNINHQAIFYSQECFSKLGKYNLKYPILADWDFNIRCFMHPDLKIKYLGNTVAIYNDLNGLSNDQWKSDVEFLKVLPLISRRQLTTELSSIKYSREYHIGRIIYSPIKKLLKLFSK